MTEWVTIDTAVLRDARKSRGLSYEAVGRSLNVAAKTYERYEKQGRVPRWQVGQIAELLGLEIERPERTHVTVSDSEHNGMDDHARFIRLGEQLSDVRSDLARVLEELQELRNERGALRSRGARAPRKR